MINNNLKPNIHLKGAYSLHTPFLELIRMITYRVSIGEWNIYYCHVVSMGCPRHIFTWHFHGLPQICGSSDWHNEKKKGISMAICFVPLFVSIFSGLYRPLIYICAIYVWIRLYVSNSTVKINLKCMIYWRRYHSLKTANTGLVIKMPKFQIIFHHINHHYTKIR